MKTLEKFKPGSMKSIRQNMASVFEDKELLKKTFVEIVSDLYTQNSEYDGKEPFNQDSFETISILDNQYVVGTINNDKNSVSHYLLPLKDGIPVREFMLLEINHINGKDFLPKLQNVGNKDLSSQLRADVYFYDDKHIIGLAHFSKTYNNAFFDADLDIHNPQMLTDFVRKCDGVEEAQKNDLIAPSIRKLLAETYVPKESDNFANFQKIFGTSKESGIGKRLGSFVAQSKLKQKHPKDIYNLQQAALVSVFLEAVDKTQKQQEYENQKPSEKPVSNLKNFGGRIS